MRVIRDFAESGDRYEIDWGPCSTKNGFAQIDTDSDASYYGNWANPFRLILVEYAEGDMTTIFCDNADEFAEELRNKSAWNERMGYRPAKIDPGFSAELKAKFIDLGLADMIH